MIGSLFKFRLFRPSRDRFSPRGGKNKKRTRQIAVFLVVILISSCFGFLAGMVASGYYYSEIKSFLSDLNAPLSEPLLTPPDQQTPSSSYTPQSSQEQAVVQAVNQVSPAVVSIVITKDVPIIEKYYSNPFGEFFGQEFEFQIPQYREGETEKKEIGGGTGFIISSEGMILTNKHVVRDEKADYTVFTNDGQKFPAEVLAKDPVKDLAIIKIENKGNSSSFPPVTLGDSSNIKIGQTAITIGNALGEFRNTVSVGVISGLGRTITASGGGLIETIDDVIQTDAAINKGNSGGPLINLEGEVVGINTATVLGAQNIGFAIPINKAKEDIQEVKNTGKITYPFLGIYYTTVTPELQERFNLSRDYGAWIGRNRYGEFTKKAIFPDSAAERAGLKRDDIILEFGGQKITTENTLAEVIMEYQPGEEVTLKILRENQEKNIKVTLGQKQSE